MVVPMSAMLNVSNNNNFISWPILIKSVSIFMVCPAFHAEIFYIRVAFPFKLRSSSTFLYHKTSNSKFILVYKAFEIKYARALMNVKMTEYTW